MLWIYDNVIVKDLQEDLGSSVSVLDPEQALQTSALLQEDKIHFPILTLTRADNFQIDSQRTNFTLMHQGVAASFDPKTNTIYNEKVIPITLQYQMTVLSAVQSDLDELIRELIFKYINQYFITVELPYEAKREIRIGLSIHPEDQIQWRSTPSNYIENGQLLSGVLTLYVDGAVIVSYAGMHLVRTSISDIKLQRPSYINKNSKYSPSITDVKHQ